MRYPPCPTHHMAAFALQLSFMYLMKAADRGLVLVMMSSCCRAQSTGSSSIPQPLPYITSPTICRIVARSPNVVIFFTAFSAHTFRTCQRQKNILAEGHTSLYIQANVRIPKPMAPCSIWRTCPGIGGTSMCWFQLVRCPLWWMKEAKMHCFLKLCCEGLETRVWDLVHESEIRRRMPQVCHFSNHKKPLRYIGDTDTMKWNAWWNQHIHE